MKNRHIHRTLIISLFLIILLNLTLGQASNQDLLLKDFINPNKDKAANVFYKLNEEIDSDLLYKQIEDEADSSNWHSFSFLADYTTKPDIISQEYGEVFRNIMTIVKSKGHKLSYYADLNYKNQILFDFLEGNKEASASYLYVEELEVDEGLDLDIPIPEGIIMSVVGINLNTNDYSNLTSLAKGESFPIHTPENAGKWKIVFFVLRESSNSIDFLSNLYSNAYLDYFFSRQLDLKSELAVTTIKDIYFSNIGLTFYGGGISWSSDFNEKYEERYGINPSILYPSLLYDNENSAYARNHLLAFRDELLSSGINKALKSFCAKNGYLSKASPFINQTIYALGFTGDLIKFYEHIDIPLFDVMVQSQEAKKHMKLVTSASYLYDKTLTSINLFNPFDTINKSNLYSLTLEAYSKGFNDIYLSSLYANKETQYNNDLKNLDFIPEYNEYVKRVNSIMQKGKQKANIAIIYPIENIYNNFSFHNEELEREHIYLDYLDIGEWIHQSLGLEYIFLHPDEISIDTLDDFSLIILPSTDIIGLNTLQALDLYYNNGGNIISTGALPSMINSNNNEEFKKIINEIFPKESGKEGTILKTTNKTKGISLKIYPYEYDTNDYMKNLNLLEQAINEAIKVRDLTFLDLEAYTNTRLSYSHRQYEDIDIFYLSNTGSKEYTGRVLLKGNVDLIILDPHTGAIIQPEIRHYKEDFIDVTSIDIDLQSMDSKIILAGKNLSTIEIPLLYTGGPDDFLASDLLFEGGKISFTFSLLEDSKIGINIGESQFVEIGREGINLFKDNSLLKELTLNLQNNLYYRFDLSLENDNLSIKVANFDPLEVKNYILEAGNIDFALTSDSNILAINILGPKSFIEKDKDFRTMFLIVILIIVLLRFTKRY